MVVLRLRREGSKNHPVFRMVAADSRAARDGRFIEVLGNYDPKKTEQKLRAKLDRVQYWLSQGAKPSARLYELLKKQHLADLGQTLTKAKPR